MGERLRSVRSKIIGVRSSAGPLDNVAISFGDGVTALYGRNGAGKTWALNAVRESFAGRAASGTHLLVSVPDGSEQRKWLENVLDERATDERWDEEDQLSRQLSISRTVTAIGRWFEEVDRRFPVWSGRPAFPFEMVAELARSPYLALVPTGISEQRWDVWLCVDPVRAADSPAIGAELHRFDQIERTTSTLAKTFWEMYEWEDSETWHELAACVERQIKECQAATDGRPSNQGVGLSGILAGFRKSSRAPDDAAWLEDAIHHWVSYAPINWLVIPAAGWIWQNESVEELHASFYYLESGKSLRRMLGDGLPVPIARIAQVDTIPWVLHDEAADENVDALTARRFAVAMASELPWKLEDRKSFTGEPAVAVTQSMDDWVRAVEVDANSILMGLLQDGPVLSLNLRFPHEWLISDPLYWTSSRGRVTVPISALSTAERRWTHVAVRRALDRVPKEPEDSGHLDDFWPPHGIRYRPADLVMIDEPETALHRAAERHMALGLDGLTASGPQVVVATHSPEVLNQPEARLVHVRRTLEGVTAAHQMVDVNIEESVSELGMLPSDLIGMHRVFLLVEGEHDDKVVRELLPEVLAAARVKIIPMRGGRHLPATVESRVLFDMTDAHVVALLDNVKASEIEAAWQEAQERYLTDGAVAAIEYLSEQFKDRKGDEYQWIEKWLSRALDKGVNERLVPFGLAAADIIEYLPVEALVPKAAGKGWADLRAEFEEQNVKNFKEWLRRRYKADTSVENIETAAKAMTSVPEEFQRLGYRLREISTRRI